MNRESYSRIPPVGAFALALAQALALWLLHQAIEDQTWPATNAGLLLGVYLVVIFVPLTLLVLWSLRSKNILWLSTVAMGIFLLWTASKSFIDLNSLGLSIALDEDRIAGFLLPWTIAWLITLPMLRTGLETTLTHMPYSALFRNTWRSYLTLAESALFTGVFWLLLLLWAALFQTLGNDFFRMIFTDQRFAYPATTLTFAAATQLIGQKDRFIDGVLDQVLGLLKWLLPLAGIIVVVFSLALLPKLPSLVVSQERIVDSAILLALVAATLLLFNAAYREGGVEPGYGHLLQQALRVVPPLLTLIALTALYSVGLRWLDVGLTPPRYWGLVTAIFAALYSMGYAYASVRTGPWMQAIQKVNRNVSAILLATLLLSLTPIADPLRLSVASQLQRALNAETADTQTSALVFLRFESGQLGRKALDDISSGRSLASSPDRVMTLRSQAAEIAGLGEKPLTTLVNDLEDAIARYPIWRAKLEVIPVETVIPPSLEDALRTEFMRSPSANKWQDNDPSPSLAFLDLDGDSTNEAILFFGSTGGSSSYLKSYRVFRLSDDHWQPLSSGSLR